MALRPVFGHHALRQRLAAAAHGGRLPSSLLFVGRQGIGKQRLALWLGQLLLCERAVANGLSEPCSVCQACRYAERLGHPDLHWFFPRSKPERASEPQDYLDDLGEAVAERAAADGLWGPSSGSEGIFIDTVRGLIKQASVRPAMASRAVFVVGDAERMAAQEGAEAAANAFLKLLEEPPPGTTIILTSSEPGALLPTIRSRVVTMRLVPVPSSEVVAFVRDPVVQRRVAGASEGDLVARAQGAPGSLLAEEASAKVLAAAREFLQAAAQSASPAATANRITVAARQGVAGARGAFSDMLEAVTVLLHERARHLAVAGEARAARQAAAAVVAVEEAKARAQGNVSPQLLSAALQETLHYLLRP